MLKYNVLFICFFVNCYMQCVCLRSRSLCRQTIGKGGTVAAYVAETGQRLFVKDILGVNCAQPLIYCYVYSYCLKWWNVFIFETQLWQILIVDWPCFTHKKIISRLCCFWYNVPLFPRKSWITNDFELLLLRMKDSLKELESKVRTTLQIGWRKVNKYNWTVFYGRLNWWSYKDLKSAGLHVLLSKAGAWKVNSFIRNKYYIYQHTINPYKKTGSSLCF